MYLGSEHGFLHTLAKNVIGSSGSWGSYATLMRLIESKREPRVPDGYRVRNGLESDLEGVVAVYNKAFSRYESFHPWRVEDARRYYAAQKLFLVVAETLGGEIVGFADGKVFQALDGGLSGEVRTVAVHPEHQGRGLGKALVAVIVKKLLDQGVRVDRISLAGMSGLERLYRKLGFREHRRLVHVDLVLSSLPSAPFPTMML